MHVERRRAPRYPERLYVVVRGDGLQAKGHTNNVGRYGMHLDLDLDARIDTNDTLHMELELPAGEYIELTASVRHKQPSEHQGFGVAFVTMSAEALQRWDRYMHEVESLGGDPATVYVPLGQHEDAGHVLTLLVWAPLKEGLQGYLAREISAGGMFVRTERMVVPGTEVDVLVVHPETEQGFPFRAEVVRCECLAPPGERGMLLRFLEPTQERRDAFLDFLRTGQVGGD